MDVLPAPLRRRLVPNWAYAARLLILVTAVSAVGVAAGYLVTAVTESSRWLSVDQSLATYLHDRACDTWLWPTALGLSVFGLPLTFYVIIGALIVFLLIRKERALVAYFVLTGLTGGIVDTVVKEVINRPRPMLGGCTVGLEGKSFPSGHMMTSTICYGMLLFALLPLVQTRWRRRAAIGFVSFGLSASVVGRSAVGAHFLSDLIAGFLLGAAWLTVATWAFGRWRADTGHQPSSMMRGADPEAIEHLAGMVRG